MKQKRIFAFFLTFILLFGCCGCSASSVGVSLLSKKKSAELTAKAQPFWAEQKEHQTGETVTVAEYIRPFSYALQYPKTGHPTVDARIEEIVQEIRTAFEQEILPAEETDGKKTRTPSNIATLYLGYEAYLTDETHMSLLFFKNHETSEGMSPHMQISAYHFDLAKDQELSAEELQWQDFTRNASAYTQKYFTTTEPYSKRIFGDYATRLAPENGRFNRFAFTADGVLFHFDRYDLFPGSMGIVSLTIPYEEMRTKIKEPATAPLQKTDKKMVALSFDDGPNPIHTTAILDILEKHNARATFFDLGYLAERFPEVVKREAALGCEVGSHSWDHKNFDKLTPEEITADVQRTDAIFQKILGRSPDSFRPPYGNCNTDAQKQIPLPIYLWSVDTLDWKSRNANAIINEVKKVGNLDGRVILLHGIYSSTAEATAYLVPYLQEQGYELVTVSELVQAKHGEIPQDYKLYSYGYFK